MDNAGLLLRVSSSGQEDGYSLADQERDRVKSESVCTLLG
jgi:hypothetical protein